MLNQNQEERGSKFRKMSETFYGIFPADDAIYTNHSAGWHQQQQQQPQQKQPIHQPGICSHGTALNSYYNTAIGNNGGVINAAAASTFDLNNNRLIGPTFRYFSKNSNGQQQQQLVYNGSIMQQHLALTDNALMPPSGLPLSAQIGAGSSYTDATMSYSCNRNRFMPYSRTAVTTSAAVAAMATVGSAYPSSNALTVRPTMTATTVMNAQQTYPAHQQFTTIYQSYPSYLFGGSSMAPITTDATTAANDTNHKYSTTEIDRRTIAVATGVTMERGVGAIGCTFSAQNANGIAVAAAHDANSVVVAEQNGDATAVSEGSCQVCTVGTSHSVTLQITNLDYAMEESSLRSFLMGQLKPITPVLSLVFEGNSYAKVTVPDMFFAKQVVSNLHRKKIGHKRMLVSYTRDSSLTEINTLRCQVAGLLKDVPYYTLPMYKFRELFQARFKTSISVLDLYKMPDICTITIDNSGEKFISLQTGLINSLENSPLIEGLQHSVPYCTVHFKREQHKGWAEQDIEPLPNVWMNIGEIQKLIYPLLKNHSGDIPVASLVHCISGQLNTEITPNENGVNLEHLVCCVQGIHIQVNNFGIKILSLMETDKEHCVNHVATMNSGAGASVGNGTLYAKSVCTVSDQISREVIELVKMSPKSTMKFNRFIPAYHNHFGKQCRVADYGYTKLIELFEALAGVVQIIGDGENRQITLTHRTQQRRFTSDLLRILRANGNKPVLLSQLPTIFAQTQNRSFDVTDYGVCDIRDILDGLANSNVVVMSRVQNSDDMLISIPKRKQTNAEMQKTILFAGEMVELFRNAPQYTILFQKFVRSYHYHFAYQCRLSDYGFLKLADLMEAIQGVVELEQTSDEDRKIYLSPKMARRVFAEQCEELVRNVTGSAQTCMKLDEVMQLHKKKFGYQIQSQTLGVSTITEAIELMPYVEWLEKEKQLWIICRREDAAFRSQCWRACKLLLTHEADLLSSVTNSAVQSDTKENQRNYFTLHRLIEEFNSKYEDHLSENSLKAMKHAIEVFSESNVTYVRITPFTKFLLSIVRLLGQRTKLLLAEIKTSLHSSISTTFEFGYPNLYSILTAYADIFVVNLGLTQERTEISLQPNCELYSSALISRVGLFGSVKSQSQSLLGKQKVARPIRLPLSENNSRSYNITGPPTKTRAIAASSENGFNQAAQNGNGKISSVTYQASLKAPRLTLTKQWPQQQQTLSHQQQVQRVAQAQQQMPNFTPLTMHAGFNGNLSIYSVASLNSSLNTSASSSTYNGDNSFNSSLGNPNSSLNSSIRSLPELNSSNGTLAHAEPPPIAASVQHATAADINMGATTLWHRRHAAAVAAAASAAYQQQAMLIENTAGLPPLIMPTPDTVVLDAHQQHQHKHQQQQQESQYPLTVIEQSSIARAEPKVTPMCSYAEQTNFPMYPMFEPPKPDTPPSNNMPFWIDPIWSHNSTATQPAQNPLLNIKLPELKSFNVLPMVLSPYTLSKAENMKQRVFSYENNHRKIA